MFPKANYTEERRTTSSVLKSFLFDFKKGEFIRQNGKLVEVHGVEALKMWIIKVLKTEKMRFKIYEQREDRTSEYGVTIEDLVIGQNLPIEYVESELEREIRVALQKNEQIIDAQNFEFSRTNHELRVSFTVIVASNESFEMEVAL